MSVDEINQKLQQAMPGLSPQLCVAARYILAHPEEVALSSMRRLAAHAEVQPSTMVRLARALDFDGFEDMRVPFCDWLRGGEGAYEARAKALHSRSERGGLAGLLSDMAASDVAAIAGACGGDAARLGLMEQAAKRLWSARRLYILGLRSCFSLAHFAHYTCSMIHGDCRLVDGAGATYRDALRGVSSDDCLLVFSFRPYAQEAVDMVAAVQGVGASVVAVTDGGASPIVGDGTLQLTVDTSSVNFFHSLTAAQSVAQQLVVSLLWEAGDKGVASIKDAEQRLREATVYWQEPKRRKRS